MTNSKNAKGPFTVHMHGLRQGGAPVKRGLESITSARTHAASYGETANGAAIFDRHNRLVGIHQRGDAGWARV